ncbi:hypothetical protein ACFVZ3_28345 [Kitasatospora purpeofusca]|uniref:hypothetical protein n=1 Tax=Kitasatospora purpeofusca TaxID=67352 RepID=UPI0036984EE0
MPRRSAGRWSRLPERRSRCGRPVTVAVRGRTVLRACLCNYRTTEDDLDLLIREVLHAADTDGRPATAATGRPPDPR